MEEFHWWHLRMPSDLTPVTPQEVFGRRFMMFWFAKGLLPVPLETAAYYLPGEKGKICGLLACHVDDLLWAGNDKTQEIMLSVQQDFICQLLKMMR